MRIDEVMATDDQGKLYLDQIDFSRTEEATGQGTATKEISSYFSTLVNQAMFKIGNYFLEMETSAYQDPVNEDGVHDTDERQGNQNESVPSVGDLCIHINEVKMFTNDLISDEQFRIAINVDGQREVLDAPLFRTTSKWYCKSPFTLRIPHYRAAVEVNIVESGKNRRIIGGAKLSAYEVMHRAADAQVNSKLYRPMDELTVRDPTGKNDIGFMQCKITFKEDLYNHFWSPLVRYAPSSPEEDLSLERFSVHIARFRALIALFNQCYVEYLRIMDWSDPLLTMALFTLFIYCTLYVKAPYALCGVIFFFVLLLTRTWWRRKYGHFRNMHIVSAMKDTFVQYRPVATLRVSILGFIPPNKPLASSAFGFLAGTDEQGFQSPTVKVSYASERFNPATMAGTTDGGSSSNTANEAGCNKDLLVGYLGASGSESSLLGPDDSSGGMTQFVSNLMKAETERKDALVLNVIDPWPVPEEVIKRHQRNNANFVRFHNADISLVYPILQPLKNNLGINLGLQSNEAQDGVDGLSSAAGSLKDVESKVVLPWTSSTACIKLALIHESKSSFLEREQEYISINISDILNNGRRVAGDSWSYELVQWSCAKSWTEETAQKVMSDVDNFLYDSNLQEGNISSQGSRSRTSSRSATPMKEPHPISSTTASTASSNLLLMSHLHSAAAAAATAVNSGVTNRNNTEVLIRVSLTLPDPRRTFSPTPEEKKVSMILQEVMCSRADKESSTLTVLWNMRDHVKYVQNVMFWILDILESFKNIFNWTAPSKTLPIYIGLIILWLLTIFIPGQLLILAVGLYQFLYVILPIPDGNELTIRFVNLLQSIPNDDDIVQIYAKERKQYVQQKQFDRKKEAREVLLNIVLPVIWTGSVQLKSSTRSAAAASSHAMSADWPVVFLVAQGKRLVWWGSSDDIDRGKVLNRTTLSPILRYLALNSLH